MKKSYYEIVSEIIVEIRPSVKNILKGGDQNLVEDLGFDSLSLMRLLVEIENRFTINFADEIIVLDYFESINKIIELVDNILDK